MIGKLIIGGQEIDLKEDIAIPITFAIADIKNPQNRKRSSSKNIAIPGTKNNLAYFSSTYQLSLTAIDTGGDFPGFTFDPTIRIEAQYYKNGKLIFDGLAQLLTVDITNKDYTFNVSLFSNFIELFEALGQKKIAELGWSEYDHILSTTNIQDSWDTSVILNGIATANFTAGVPDGFGYLYALCDYGYEPNLRDFKNNNLFPHVYHKEIMEKCFALASQTIDSDFFDTERFKRRVLGFGGGQKVTISPTDVLARKVDYTATGNYTVQINNSYNQFIPDNGFPGSVDHYKYTYGFNQSLNIFDSFWSATTLVSDTLAQFDETTGLLTIARSGNYSFRFQGTFDIDTTIVGAIIGASGQWGFRADLLKNGYSVGIITLNNFGTDLTEIKDITFNLNLVAGDILTIQLKCFNTPTITLDSVNPPTSAPYFDFVLTNTGDWQFTLSSIQAPIVDGDTVYVANFLPELLCSEFVKGVLTEYNLYVNDPDKDGVVKIEPLEDYYYPTNVFDDWSNKQDLSKKRTISPASNIEGKIYAFKFMPDDDYYNKLYRTQYNIGYGDYNYQVQSTSQTGERVYQLPWSQTIPVEVPGTNIRLPTIISVNEITNVVSPFKGKPRSFYYQGLKTCDSWVLRNSTTPTTFDTLVSYPACSHLDDYDVPTFDNNWGLPQLVYWTAPAYTLINLFSEYHDKFIKEITGRDSKILTEYFKLTVEDVQIEKFRTFAMINGVLFRKNLIKDYSSNGEQTVQCELVRIIEADKRRDLIAYLPSYTIIGVDILHGGTDLDSDPGVGTMRGGIDSSDVDSRVIYG